MEGSRFERYAAPAALAIAGLAFTLIALVATTTPILDPDVWWVARAGREMIERGDVPRFNAFSFTEPNRPWVMHEWLFALPYALGLTAIGPAFFQLVALIAGAATAALVLYECRGDADGAIYGALLGGLALFCFGLRLASARPSNVGLLFPIAMAALAFRPLKASRIALALALEWLWANAHGSFPLGAVIWGAALIHAPGERLRRAFIGVGLALVTVVNPYGLALHRLVVDYTLGRSEIAKVIHAHVAEFAPLGTGRAWWGHILGTLIVLMLVGFALRRRDQRGRLVLLGLLVVLAIKNTRHVELAGLLSIVLLAPNAARALAARHPLNWSVSREGFVALALAPGLVAGIGAFALQTHSTTRPIAASLGGSEVAEAIQSLPRGARVYAPFRTTGLLLWYGQPRSVSAFYDLRNDCYSAELASQFFAIDSGSMPPADARITLEQRGTTHVLIPADHALVRALDGDPGWQRALLKGGWVLFARTASPDVPR